MEKESIRDVEYVPVEVPGDVYERKLYRLAIALLDSLEKKPKQEEDTKQSEVA